jgi:hypothetical protein
MPVVIVCPACQQKARVPEAMLGQSVKCPACGATFPAPADGSAATPAGPSPAPPEPVRPLPADPDSLRAVRVGTGVQIIALGLYAAALGLFLFLFMMTVAATSGMGGRGRAASVVPAIVTTVAALLLAASGLSGIVGASLSALAPPAHLARGLAIAALILSVLAFERLTSSANWWVGLYAESPSWSRAGGVFLLTGLALIWLFEVARLTALALFWRAVFRILHDARGATTAWRLAVAGPVIHAVFVAAWTVLAVFGGLDSEMALIGVAGWLVLQLIVLLFAVGVAARLRRRLAAVVPAGP